MTRGLGRVHLSIQGGPGREALSCLSSSQALRDLRGEVVEMSVSRNE